MGLGEMTEEEIVSSDNRWQCHVDTQEQSKGSITPSSKAVVTMHCKYSAEN